MADFFFTDKIYFVVKTVNESFIKESPHRTCKFFMFISVYNFSGMVCDWTHISPGCVNGYNMIERKGTSTYFTFIRAIQ